jgi:hypothetical protein
MAAAHILTRGFGNGSLVGSPSLVLSLGYGHGSSVVTYGPSCGPRSVTNIGPRSVLGVGVLSVGNIGPRSVECCNDC